MFLDTVVAQSCVCEFLLQLLQQFAQELPEITMNHQKNHVIFHPVCDFHQFGQKKCSCFSLGQFSSHMYTHTVVCVN